VSSTACVLPNAIEAIAAAYQSVTGSSNAFTPEA
jgi:hypothetical protein